MTAYHWGQREEVDGVHACLGVEGEKLIWFYEGDSREELA